VHIRSHGVTLLPVGGDLAVSKVSSASKPDALLHAGRGEGAAHILSVQPNQRLLQCNSASQHSRCCCCCPRLCLSTLGEMTVYYGASDPKIRWRSASPLGTRGNSRLPYTLTLNSDRTLTGVW
jgi:hypothetical protein